MTPILLMVALMPVCAEARTGSDRAALVREYFVRQEAGQPLVIRVNPYEAEFRVSVSGPNDERLMQSELPNNRTQPLFLYVDGSDRARQLDIVVEAPVFSRETRFELEFYRLDVRDSLSEKLARAYQLLSRGQEFLEADTAANWSVRINLLVQAARLFEEFGMEELRLWAVLAAAHLAHYELGESGTALEWAGQVLVAARLSALPGPGFAGQVLNGEILFQLADRVDSNRPSQQAAQIALVDTVQLAGLTGNRYEQAWALFLLGESLAAQDQHQPALERYEQALAIAEQREAEELTGEIRKRMVAAHERLGNVEATEQTLGSMVEQLAGAGADTELVKGLIAQGQLYLDLFRYPDAEAALREALEIDSVSLTQVHASVLLGQAIYESGRFEEAAQVLASALVNPQTGLFRRPNPLLPLADGLDALAGAYRQMGLHAEARRVRSVLSRHLETSADTAHWARQRVLDELAAGNVAAAAEVYRDSQPRFRAQAGGLQGALARLALCADLRTRQAPCDSAGIHSGLRSGEQGGPREVLDARLNHARILASEGRRRDAAAAFDSLLFDVHFYHSELSGVLGAWFWRSRDEVFRSALQTVSGASPSESLSSFAMLARILAIGRVVTHYDGDDSLRAELATAAAGWNEAVSDSRKRFGMATARFSPESIRHWLEDLSHQETVLALLPERDGVRAWLAGRDGVAYLELPAPGDLGSVLAGLPDNDTTGARARAGQVLLAGLEDQLSETVYWLPVGQMLGADPGRFLLKDRRAGANRHFIGLLDFPSLTRPAAELDPGWAARVFLAGDPVDWSAAVPERLSVGAEMEAVRERFAGPGLHMVQGNALLIDEFGDLKWQQASLVHLALPVRIDLARPEHSELELSEPSRGAGRQLLFPGDARDWELGADLVVLGQVTLGDGDGLGDYDSRLGWISDLIEAGANRIVLCRPNQAERPARFMENFYREIARSRHVADALREASGNDGLTPSCQLYRP